MFDTYTAAHMVDRDLVLKRAERRVPLLDVANRSGSAPMAAHARPTTTRMSWWTHALRSFRWPLRPAHA